VKVVEGDHLIRVDELVRERGADEARPACDQDPFPGQRHAASLPGRIVTILRGAVVIVVALVLAGLLVGGAPGASGSTSLRIVVRASPTAPARIETLRCHPPRGTVSHPAQACNRLLAAGRSLFAPTPPETACTQIYGGPQQALVTGTVSGARVWARFTRRDGCELARWNRVAFLFAHN
jgi:hypothetical protein